MTIGNDDASAPPEDSVGPRVRVIILCGPSGSGKTSLARRIGIPSISLDHFYRDDNEPGLPMLGDALVNWDDPRSWNGDMAATTLVELCRSGSADLPIYDIPTNRRTGSERFELGEDETLVIAEGIFASELVEPLRRAGVLADALCIARSPLRNMWFRLLRDLREHRKPAHVLVWRGFRLAWEEPAKVRSWVARGCRPMRSIDEGAAAIRALTADAPRP